MKPKSREKVRSLGPLIHSSVNPHMLFVPLAAFGNRPIDGRLLRTIVPDDESVPSHAFIEVAEDEWIKETSHSAS